MVEQSIEDALQKARTPGPVICPVSGEKLWAPMDKLSIALYGKSSVELEHEHQINNLFKLIELL